MSDITRRIPDCNDDCEGERGKRGKRGHRGHDGHDGHDGATGPTGPVGPVAIEQTPSVSLTGNGTGSDPLGIVVTAPLTTIVYRPADPLGDHGNVYVTWATTYAAIESVRSRGQLQLQFDGRYIAAPCPIPPGTWNMAGVTWCNAQGFLPDATPTQVEMLDGCEIVMLVPPGVDPGINEMLRLDGEGLQIIFNGRYPGPGPNQGGTGITPFSQFVGIFFVGSTAQLKNTDAFAAPMCKVSPNQGAFFFVMQGHNNTVGVGAAFVGPAASPAPIIDANGGFVEFEMGGGNIADNALIDTAGGGFFVMHFGDDNACGGQVGVELAEDSVAPTYNYPAIDATQTFFRWLPAARPRNFLRTSALAAGYAGLGAPGPVLVGPYDAAYNELIVCDTSGGDIAVNAPRAFPAQGERLSIRNYAGLNNVNVIPAPVVLPQHPFVDVVEDPIVGPGVTKTWISDGYGTWLVLSTN